MSLYQALMNQIVRDVQFEQQWVRGYSPAEIRETIQSLMGVDQYDLAFALGDAGLSLYPSSEDLLAVTGLMALMRQDWPLAVDLLTQLRELQGQHTPLFTFVMLVQALRCNLEHAKALALVRQGLAMYPDHTELVAHQLALEDRGPWSDTARLPQ